ncbi:peptide chain release factor aRF-1 [Candidatus Woesearchaeota archaeon]|nr:peptide chain release factor aRF-1 [Candidatus Woesearchaeota archaeon]
MSITAMQRFKLRKIIKELENFRGRHTELVTVYIPKDYDLNKIINHLSQEVGTASNIKSTATRKNVTDALEKMIQHLRLYKRTPENGLMAFSGNVAEREGQSDVRVWSVEPPVPLNQRLYRCDKEFVLDVIRDMCEEKEVYAFVVLDKRDAHLALLRGKTIVPVAKTHSEVPGKMRAGGQSSVRFERNRELALKDHLKKVGDYMKDNFLPMIGQIKGIIVGGPGQTKYEFVEGDYITDQVRRKVIAIKDIGYTEEVGLQELLDRSDDVLAQEEVVDEKRIMNKFFLLLSTKPNMVCYGEADAIKFLEIGVVDTLLLSESLSDETISRFEEAAQKFNSIVKIISTETREGVQLRDIGKAAAILRYEVHQE